MIDALYITAEDSVRTKKAGELVTEGQPLALDANGQLVGATAGSGVFGINKVDSNAFHNYAFGELGAYGTGCLTVVTKGTVRVKDSVYNQIEIDTQSQPSGSGTTIQLLATGVTWAVDDKLYMTAAGLISNVAAGDAFGRVTATPAMTGGWLEFEVDATGMAS